MSDERFRSGRQAGSTRGITYGGQGRESRFGDTPA